MDNCAFLEEIEVLESIYLDDLTVCRGERHTTLGITLHPATADNRDERYVCMTLELCLSDMYPTEIPKVVVKNPRGVSEAHVSSIIENATALAEQKIGDAMLFELIEYAKDCLTDNNRPSCICTICLEHFVDSDDFTRTDCYHYFHSHCFKRYVILSNAGNTDAGATNEPNSDGRSKELVCPVCRLPVVVDVSKLPDEIPPSSSSEEVKFVPSKAYLQWKENMKQHFERQKKAGGIIDIEAERNRFLVEIADVNSVSDSVAGVECPISPSDFSSDHEENTLSKQNNTATYQVEHKLEKQAQNCHYDSSSSKRSNRRVGARDGAGVTTNLDEKGTKGSKSRTLSGRNADFNSNVKGEFSNRSVRPSRGRGNPDVRDKRYFKESSRGRYRSERHNLKRSDDYVSTEAQCIDEDRRIFRSDYSLARGRGDTNIPRTRKRKEYKDVSLKDKEDALMNSNSRDNGEPRHSHSTKFSPTSSISQTTTSLETSNDSNIDNVVVKSVRPPPGFENLQIKES